jgi:cell division septation protein DedD
VLQGIGSLRRIESQWTFKASLEANFLSSSFGLPMFRMDLASSESIAPSRTAKGEAPRVRSWQAAAIVAGALGLAAIGGSKDNVRTTVQQATIDWNVSDWFQSQKSTLIRTWDSWSASVEEFVTPANEPVREDATLPASQPAEVPASEAESKPAAKEPAAKEPAAKEPAAKEPAAKGANEPISANLANLAKKANEPVSAKKSTSAPANESVSAQKPTSQRADQPYALIVGAFADDANAIRLVSDLKKSGFPAEVLDAKVGLKKVALRTFASEDAARKAKDQLKGDFPAIWIYHE